LEQMPLMRFVGLTSIYQYPAAIGYLPRGQVLLCRSTVQS
jgi:hypothetical protein